MTHIFMNKYIYLSYSFLLVYDTVKSFSFVGHLILCISLVGKSTNLRFQRNIDLFLKLCVLI